MPLPNNLNAITKVDLLVFTGAGTLDNIIITQDDAAPTAGTIDIYDNTTNSGRKIFTWNLTTAVFNPISIPFNFKFNTGLYVKFTTTADVNVILNFSS